MVDDYGDIFFDFNCDEQLDEWCSICHPGWDEICSDVPEECGPEGPFAHCPECPPWEP